MTTAASGRIRRSIRFARLDAQAGPAFRDTSLRRERMTVPDRLEMPSYQNTQDWTGGMGMSPSGRFRVAEDPFQKRKSFTREGIRADWARGILWVLAALMCVVLLAELATAGAGAIQIQKLESRIEKAQSAGEALQAKLAVSSGDITVCTKAVELNLISSGGAPTIILTAPAAATMTLVAMPEAAATEEPELRASAGR